MRQSLAGLELVDPVEEDLVEELVGGSSETTSSAFMIGMRASTKREPTEKCRTSLRVDRVLRDHAVRMLSLRDVDRLEAPLEQGQVRRLADVAFSVPVDLVALLVEAALWLGGVSIMVIDFLVLRAVYASDRLLKWSSRSCDQVDRFGSSVAFRCLRPVSCSSSWVAERRRIALSQGDVRGAVDTMRSDSRCHCRVAAFAGTSSRFSGPRFPRRTLAPRRVGCRICRSADCSNEALPTIR